MAKEMTLEERIAFVKAKYEADPNYKPPPPTFKVQAVDLSIKTAEAVSTGKSVISLIAAAETKRDQRRVIQDIERKLKPVQNVSVPPTIDETTIKRLPAVVRSKVVSGQERARFLLDCIEWEKEHPDSDGELYFWSGKALSDIAAWIGVCENDKTEIKQIFNMCQVLFQSRHVTSDDKLNLASSFFTSNLIEYYPELFNTILSCPFTRLLDRSECCKYLYHSDIEKYVPSIEGHLGEIIDSDIDDDTRYESLACFVTTTGVASKYLNNPLPVGEVNQNLLTRLFKRFVSTRSRTDSLYIIYACEFLLEQNVDTSIYPEISTILLEIASGNYLEKGNRPDDRTRADAADVLLNHPICGEEITRRAQEIIHQIGESGQTELEKTIYSNKENVHMLNDTFKTYIETNHTKYVGKLMKMVDLCEYIEQLADEMALSEESIFKIRQSIDRIMVEPTLHTARKVSTSEIFRLIKHLIDNHPDKQVLQGRLLEELEDMANTCSSGHAKRLVNVMVGFTDSLEGSINIKDQFIANIKARLMATIRHLDEEKREFLLEAMVSTGDEKQPFNAHIKSVAPAIEAELRGEFIDEGWLSEKKFNQIFKETVDKIIC
jgi:hypothetical protein